MELQNITLVIWKCYLRTNPKRICLFCLADAAIDLILLMSMSAMNWINNLLSIVAEEWTLSRFISKVLGNYESAYQQVESARRVQAEKGRKGAHRF